ncbi:hypothetical protein ACQP1W_27990 [Spirillospora sp. CA-255316]
MTCFAVAGLAAVLGMLRWDQANKVATSVSALAALAAVGVAVWAAVSRPNRGTVRVSDSGNATAGRGGTASTGVRGPADGRAGDVVVERSGDADASAGGEASTGADLT